MNDVVDIYDYQRNKTNKITLRNELGPNEYKLAAVVWIMNSNNEFLIQLRTKDRRNDPNKWCVSGGAALSGETSIEAAIRELKEENSLIIEPQELEYIASFKKPPTNSIIDVWLLKKDIELNTIKIDPVEVQEVKWVTALEYQKLINNGQATPFTFDCLIKYLNYLNKKDL